ncbi:125_t:CDS:2 [Funneliformis geosporum]|nr:125_t:CDS:2 [Funneliformis geosporum]
MLDDNLILKDFNEDNEELERLIALLSETEGGLTNDEIVDTVLNLNKKEESIADKIEFTPVLEKASPEEAKKAMDKITRFLYEQEKEFGDELKNLKRLDK